MKYVAIYTEAAAVSAAIKAAVGLIAADTYYPRQHATETSGTGLVWWSQDSSEFSVRSPDGETLAAWTWAVGLDSVLDSEDHADFIDDLGGIVGWDSCKGNKVEYDFCTPGQVRVTITSRRHGIPCRAMAEFEPTEVVQYITDRPEWSPWATADTEKEANHA